MIFADAGRRRFPAIRIFESICFVAGVGAVNVLDSPEVLKTDNKSVRFLLMSNRFLFYVKIVTCVECDEYVQCGGKRACPNSP